MVVESGSGTKELKNSSVPLASTTTTPAGTPVLAPLNGTFYRSDAPGKPPMAGDGAAVKAGDAVCVVEAMKLFMVNQDDRICLFLPLFHIFGFGASFLPALFCGASLHIPENTHPDVILKTIYENRCTIFHSIPTMILAILKHTKCNRKNNISCTLLPYRIRLRFNRTNNRYKVVKIFIYFIKR